MAHIEPVSAAEVFIQNLAGQVNQHDIETKLQAQKLMLLRFEKTNEMLLNCNALSAGRFHMSSQEFKKHTQQLLEMKKDLDSVFKRIRNIKCKLAAQYPEAFKACSDVYNVLEEEDETDENTKEQNPSVNKDQLSEPQPKHPQSSSCSQTTTPSPVTSPSSSDT